MSIGKRFINLVRANVNSVLDRTVGGDSGRIHIEELSDAELEAELTRRRQRRNAAERAAERSAYEEAWEEVEQAVGKDSVRFRTTGRRTSSYRRAPFGGGAAGRRAPGPRPSARDPRLAQLYAQLECPYGADLTVVRKCYRTLMRKYHPDMHSGKPEKQRIATELSQHLTMAYNELRRALSHPGT